MDYKIEKANTNNNKARFFTLIVKNNFGSGYFVLDAEISKKELKFDGCMKMSIGVANHILENKDGITDYVFNCEEDIDTYYVFRSEISTEDANRLYFSKKENNPELNIHEGMKLKNL